MANKVASKELRERKDQYMYVDVREAAELEEGKIDGAVNIPLGQLIRKARHGDIDDLKGKKIITYCNSGYRGNIAADELNKQGFDTVTIEGGTGIYDINGFQVRFFTENEIQDLMKGFELLWIREEYEEPVTLYLVSSRKWFNYPDKKEMP